MVRRSKLPECQPDGIYIHSTHPRRYLEIAPSTNVVDQYYCEIGPSSLYISNQLLQAVTPVDAQPALPCIRVHLHYFEVVFVRELLESGALVLNRMILWSAGHADVHGSMLALDAGGVWQKRRTCHDGTAIRAYEPLLMRKTG